MKTLHNRLMVEGMSMDRGLPSPTHCLPVASQFTEAAPQKRTVRYGIRFAAALLAVALAILQPMMAAAAPADPLSSFTPDLGGPQLKPRAEEAGQYGVA